MMGRYNLLDEKWIEVISLADGNQTEVSLLEVFSDAANIKCLAGEMKTQNFALLRFLIAIIQTVFSRLDCSGEPYSYIRLDQRLAQIGEVEEDDREDYAYELRDNWKKIWELRHFPDIICIYLEKWRDHFNLYDDKYPFYQLTEEEMHHIKPDIIKPNFCGKNLNRLISESGNKTALFSPLEEDCKDIMTSGELSRWLIMLQGYMGLQDKAEFKGENQKASRGWLYDIGGLYLRGDNLFETLMMNYIPVHPEERYQCRPERPCWEITGLDNVSRLRNGEPIDNLSQLYTNWSRAVSMDMNRGEDAPVALKVVKLPKILHEDNFLEPMTVWKKNKDGHYIPMMHSPDKAMWRSFGLITLRSDGKDQHQPAITGHLDDIRGVCGSRWISICAVSMRDDGKPASQCLADEIIDELSANDLVIADTSDRGWIVRISDTVQITKEVAYIYQRFLENVSKIRGQDPKGKGQAKAKAKKFIDSESERFYQKLNEPFYGWLAGIHPEDAKNDKVAEWYSTLERLALQQADSIVDMATTRDFIGSKKEDFNIINANEIFRHQVLKKLEG